MSGAEISVLLGTAVLALLTAAIKIRSGRRGRASAESAENYDARIRALSQKLDRERDHLERLLRDHVASTQPGYIQLATTVASMEEIRRTLSSMIGKAEDEHERLSRHLADFYALRERVSVLEGLFRKVS